MTEDWYIFKEYYKDGNLTYDYLGLLNYTYTTEEKNKRLREEADKHKNCYVLAFKLVKGYQK